MDVVRNFLTRYEQTREEELSIEDYLDACKRSPLVYATAAERMLAAIGEPELLDTRHDQRLSRLFGNKVIKIYPAFRDFYGLEDPIEQVVSYFRHAAQGLVQCGSSRRQEHHLITTPVRDSRQRRGHRTHDRDAA